LDVVVFLAGAVGEEGEEKMTHDGMMNDECSIAQFRRSPFVIRHFPGICL
jgi:hypothetical protein